MTTAQVTEAVFDSHRFVRRLTEAGLQEEVAVALAEEHMGPWIRNVATKADLAMIRADVETLRTDFKNSKTEIREDIKNFEVNIRRDVATKPDLAMIRADVDKRIAEVRAELIKWMFGALMLQAALVVALIKLLP